MSNDTKKIYQKEKAKKKCIKVLNILCYIGTSLLVLLLLLTGLQSCKHDKGYSSVSAETTNEVVNLSQTTWLLNDVIDDEYVDYYVKFTIESGTAFDEFYVNNANNEVKLYYGYEDEYTIAYTSQGGFEGISYKTLVFYDEYNSNNYTNTELISWLQRNGRLQTPIEHFTFNKVFNYNAPMGLTTASPYGMGATWTQSDSTYGYIDYDVGPFMSNGKIYKTIRYRCLSGASMNFKIPTEAGTIQNKLGPAGSWSFMFLEYVGYDNMSDIACMRDQSPYTKDGGYSFLQENSATWQVDNYRYLTFIGQLTDEQKTALNKFNNNNQNAYIGSEVGSEVTNVFTLIGSAFSSWIPLLSVYVLPSITLGTLLFIPLVATLVFVIIKIIKK